MDWTKQKLKEKLQEISDKGYITITDDMYRKDDGIIGQILEREFQIQENNLPIADLGNYELKAKRIRKSSSELTLFHKTAAIGMTQTELLENFGYIKESTRNTQLKKKLFTTIKGSKENNRGFIIKSNGNYIFDLYNNDKYLATWDLSENIQKIDKLLLVFAETKGKTCSKEESFHYKEAYILTNPKYFNDAIANGIITLGLNIDQILSPLQKPHDRGPQIRISTKKLHMLYEKIERIL